MSCADCTGLHGAGAVWACLTPAHMACPVAQWSGCQSAWCTGAAQEQEGAPRPSGRSGSRVAGAVPSQAAECRRCKAAARLCQIISCRAAATTPAGMHKSTSCLGKTLDWLVASVIHYCNQHMHICKGGICGWDSELALLLHQACSAAIEHVWRTRYKQPHAGLGRKSCSGDVASAIVSPSSAAPSRSTSRCQHCLHVGSNPWATPHVPSCRTNSIA